MQEKGPMMSYLIGERSLKVTEPETRRPAFFISSTIPPVPKWFFLMSTQSLRIRFRKVRYGKDIFQALSSVISWSEQELRLPDLWIAGITASVCVSDWHLKYQPQK